MNTITHDPTRGWLLLTEKWPEKWKFTYEDGFFDEVEYQIAEKNCLSTAIEIAREDWDAVKKLVLTDVVPKCYVSPCEAIGEYPCGNCKAMVKYIIKEGGRGHIEDHHPYSVDAEFEVVEQWSLKGENDWYSDEDDRFDLHHPDDCDYRKIARLVKAKEDIDPDYTNYTPPKQENESQDELWDEVDRLVYISSGNPTLLIRSKFRIERI